MIIPPQTTQEKKYSCPETRADRPVGARDPVFLIISSRANASPVFYAVENKRVGRDLGKEGVGKIGKDDIPV